jgi:hypothetical protein
MAVYENAAPINVTTGNFITAAGLTNQTHLRAVSYLSSNLISTGLYDKMLAIWPMVGGTATTHKFNLKNPVDSNAAFRLTFLGSWTHDSTGAKPDGGGGTYANTYLQATNTFLSLNSISLWYYSTTSPVGSYQDYMGANNGSFSTGARIATNPGDNSNHNLNSNEASFSVTVKTGLIGLSRLISTEFTRYNRGVGETNSSAGAVSTAQQAYNFYLGALNSNNNVNEPTTCGCAFSAIGLGLTSTEASTFNAIVQQYQTILGRNVY